MRKVLLVLAVLMLVALLPSPIADAETHQVNVLLVSPPGETWTDEEKLRAVGATMEAVQWWTRNSKVSVPSFELGWTTIITPTDFSYSVHAWQRPWMNFPTDNLTVFVIDNSQSRKTMDGAVGLSQVPCKVVTAVAYAISDQQDGLESIIAHEMGHAILGLDHAPLGTFDIMSPSPPLAAYQMDTIGYHTRVALGEPFHKWYLP